MPQCTRGNKDNIWLSVLSFHQVEARIKFMSSAWAASTLLVILPAFVCASVCVLIFILLSFKSVVVGKGGVCICGGMCTLVQVFARSRGVQKKVSDSLDLELQTVVGHSKLMLATEFMFLVTESSLQCPTFANMFLLCTCVCFLIIHWLLVK